MAAPGPDRERPKPAPSDFRDFADYEGFLVDTLRAIGRNASSPARAQTYRWLSSVSAGYDSAAAAALAKNVRHSPQEANPLRARLSGRSHRHGVR